MNSQPNNLLLQGLVGAQSKKKLNVSHHITLSLQGHGISQDSKGMDFCIALEIYKIIMQKTSQDLFAMSMAKQAWI